MIYNELMKKFKELFNCSREISTDEAMVPFKGKFAIKVTIPDKPVKFGVKFFALCDAKTGCCKNFTMYAGQDNHQAGKRKSRKVVMDLLKDLYYTNHHLYVDNFYTGSILFLMLKERGILAAGTTRPGRGYLYDQLKRIQLRMHRDVAWLTAKDQRMTALKWKDKKMHSF